MNKLQMLIKWAKAEQEKAVKEAKEENKLGNIMLSNMLTERWNAFSDMITKAELLLKEETAKDLPNKKQCTCTSWFKVKGCPVHGD